MDAARWQRLEAVCFAALEREPAERQAFLLQECGDDGPLQRDALTLLRQLEDDPGFLQRPLVDWSGLATGDPDAAAPAEQSIGPYRLIRHLGRGGMGDVHLAIRETEDIRQEVAVKIIRRGMDTDEVLRRFRLERRILASLHHPNIARLLDASATEDGRPYFVMEFVDGVPLDRYCDQRGLTLPQRLQLVQVICAAVQHAHQNLVVHRDLKPRNILVTSDGTVKLLDFGIGKVLAPTEALSPDVETRTNVRLLTPEYAAPEQVTGDHVTAATDVYALGVLTYALLTGRHPFLTGDESLADIERAVREAEPKRPSQAASDTDTRRRLSGDLDTIVLKALRKEPDRRYPSAAALSDDIQRYLEQRPVSARPDTLRYRAGKFVRRNAGWVATGAMALFGLTATTVVTLVQSRRVRIEATRALQERDKAVEVRSFLMEMFGASGANRAVGDTVTAKRLLDLQSANLQTAYADRPELKAQMMEVLADGYDRLGLYQAAEPLANDALELRRRSLAPGHPDIAASLNLSGWITHELGRSKDAELMLREAVEIRRAAGPRYRQDLSRSLNDLGVTLNALAQYAPAESALTEALALRQAEFGSDHRSVGITSSNLAAAYYYQAKFEDAIRVQAQALQVIQKWVGPDHQRSTIALSNLVAFKRAKGDGKGAVADYRELLARQSRIQGREHPVTVRVISGLAGTLYDLAVTTHDSAQVREAEALYAQAAGALRSSLGPNHPEVAVFESRQAEAMAFLGRNREAMVMADRAVATLLASQGEKHRVTAAALGASAIPRRRLGQLQEALVLQRRALAAFEASLGTNHVETSKALVTLCDLLIGNRLWEEALPLCTRSEAAIRGAQAGSRYHVPIAQLQLATVHIAHGHKSIADSLTEAARQGMQAGLSSREAERLLSLITASAVVSK
jgi:tetratricopeptide (TPR) repeat protein